MNKGQDLDPIRKLADRLGMPSFDPVDKKAIESADEFIARMKTAGIEPGASSPNKFGKSRTRRLAFAGTIATAAAVLTVLGVVIPWNSNSAYAHTPPMLTYGFADSGRVAYAPGRPARSALLRLAQVALASPTTGQPGQGAQHVQTSGWYAQLDSRAATNSARVIPTLRDTRLESDGTLLAVERRGKPLAADGRGISGHVRTPKTTEKVPPGSFDPAWASELGADPDLVRKQLLQRADCQSADATTETACLVNAIVTLNENWVVMPQLRSALWTTLAGQPEVRSLGDVTDRAGRPGTGFAVDSKGPPALRRILIIGRERGQLLGIEDVLTKDDADTKVEAPAVYAFTAILKSEWVRGPSS